ncbi:MAG: DUF4097 domain-containing protein [Defluviitaleaceae bacterium]|nr:DUF4097 domain-containing protein [Defluviitaleaceae bacterium]
MQEERLKILEMLKDGAINVEDSIKLMETLKSMEAQRSKELDEEDEREPNFIWVEKNLGRKNTKVFNQISDIVETITENVTKGINDTIIHVDRFEGDGFAKSEEFIFTANVDEVLKSMRLKGKNGSIVVKNHDKDSIELRGEYRPKWGIEPNFKMVSKKGSVKLDYDYNAVRSLSLRVLVPDVLIKELDLDTRNGSIALENLKPKTVYAKSSNGDISAKNTESDLFVFDTSNSPIALEDVKVVKAKLSTKNSPIKIEKVLATEIQARTSNSRISVESLEPIEKEVMLEAQTKNSGINVELDGLAVKFRASTDPGKVIAAGDFIYSENSKSFIKGESPNYGDAQKRANLNLSTSNANIKIEA